MHADAPESLDAYYQQVGRAGRDGERARAVLFASPDGYGLRLPELRQLRRGSGGPAGGGPFAIGQGVDHSEWGRGTVQQFEPGRVVVLFDHAGYRTLSLDLVEENNLLRPAS